YGFKSIKWLTHLVLTNHHHANDTYADKDNDIESPMKTFARFFAKEINAKAGRPTPVTGIAQVGMNGLTRVQFHIVNRERELPEDDPYLLKAEWQEGDILPPPKPGDWGGGAPNGDIPARTHGFDDAGRPLRWPMPYTTAHWAAVLPALPKGVYHLRARSIDNNGHPQPFPREFGKSGKVGLHRINLRVT
ncbi:MAG: hypothetical protein ACYTGQ_10590, partial [Planctomycetota bacterium]